MYLYFPGNKEIWYLNQFESDSLEYDTWWIVKEKRRFGRKIKSNQSNNMAAPERLIQFTVVLTFIFGTTRSLPEIIKIGKYYIRAIKTWKKKLLKQLFLMGFFLQNNNCQKYPREIALMLVRKLHQFWGLSTIIIYHYGKKIHDVAIYAW